LSQVIDALLQAAACGRTGDYGQAASLSNEALGTLQLMCTNCKFPAAILEKILYSLETALLMQQNKNWVAWADVLEYELTQLLKKVPSQ
jgi:hypothetical protein